jgi:hypothetical protein
VTLKQRLPSSNSSFLSLKLQPTFEAKHRLFSSTTNPTHPFFNAAIFFKEDPKIQKTNSFLFAKCHSYTNYMLQVDSYQLSFH